VNKLKFGVLGWRHDHVEQLIREAKELGHEFVGICEHDNPKIEKMLEKYQTSLLTEEELFALKPEVIFTTAINNEKIDVIEKCNDRGIHVLADKPIVVNMEDYKRLEKVVQEGKIQVGLQLTERYDPAVYTLRNLISEGKLGDLVSFTSFGPHKLVKNSRPAWHFVEEQCGGVGVDLLIHHVDLLRWFSGSEVKESSGFLVKSDKHPEHPTFYETANVTVITENHVIGALQSDWWQPLAPDDYGDARVMCIGTAGRAIVKTGDKLTQKDAWHLFISTTEEKTVEVELQDLPVTLTEDFFNRIAGREDVIVNADDILKSTYATLIVNSKAVKIQ
jgi:predicted dehydrogenase